jgi:hypothetical protein
MYNVRSYFMRQLWRPVRAVLRPFTDACNFVQTILYILWCFICETLFRPILLRVSPRYVCACPICDKLVKPTDLQAIVTPSERHVLTKPCCTECRTHRYWRECSAYHLVRGAGDTRWDVYQLELTLRIRFEIRWGLILPSTVREHTWLCKRMRDEGHDGWVWGKLARQLQPHVPEGQVWVLWEGEVLDFHAAYRQRLLDNQREELARTAKRGAEDIIATNARLTADAAREAVRSGYRQPSQMTDTTFIAPNLVTTKIQIRRLPGAVDLDDAWIESEFSTRFRTAMGYRMERAVDEERRFMDRVNFTEDNIVRLRELGRRYMGMAQSVCNIYDPREREAVRSSVFNIMTKWQQDVHELETNMVKEELFQAERLPVAKRAQALVWDIRQLEVDLLTVMASLSAQPSYSDEGYF